MADFPKFKSLDLIPYWNSYLTLYFYNRMKITNNLFENWSGQGKLKLLSKVVRENLFWKLLDFNFWKR